MSKHILTITEDHVEVARIRADGGDDAEVRSDAWSWQITCPHDPTDRSRPCQTWMECCVLSADQLDALDENGDGPCPLSPTGRHENVNIDWFRVGYRTRDCYLRVGEEIADRVRGLLLPLLAPGQHRVDIDWDEHDFVTLRPAPDELGER